jgi:hypothetical protein
MKKEVARLETFAPFSKGNLTQHIIKNRTKWEAFMKIDEDAYKFSSLPNAPIVRLSPSANYP